MVLHHYVTTHDLLRELIASSARTDGIITSSLVMTSSLMMPLPVGI
jgi:hypothetical protein